MNCIFKYTPFVSPVRFTGLFEYSGSHDKFHIHYDNTPMQCTVNFNGCKNDNFKLKMFDIFSSPEPLYIVYPSSQRPSVVRPPFSKIFSSETTGPIKAKFHVKPP